MKKLCKTILSLLLTTMMLAGTLCSIVQANDINDTGKEPSTELTTSVKEDTSLQQIETAQEETPNQKDAATQEDTALQKDAATQEDTALQKDAAAQEDEPAMENAALTEDKPTPEKTETAIDEPPQVTLLAEAEINGYKVTFHANFGPEKPGVLNWQDGETAPAYADETGWVKLTKCGFSWWCESSMAISYVPMTGWATSKNGKPVYEDQAEFYINKDMDLYATWELVSSKPLMKKQPRTVNGLAYTAEPQDVIEQGSLTNASTGKTVEMAYMPHEGEDYYTPKKQTDAGDYSYRYGYMNGDNFVEMGTLTGHIDKADITKYFFDYGDAYDTPYDGQAHTLTVTLNPDVTGLIYHTEWTLSSGPSVEPPLKDVGHYYLYAVAESGSSNFNPGKAYLNGFKISPQPLTVIPKAGQSKQWADEDPVFEVDRITGAAPGETPKYTADLLSREAGENPKGYEEGTTGYAYAVNGSALLDNGAFKASNYTVKLADDPPTFVINKRNINNREDKRINVVYDEYLEYQGSKFVKPDPHLSITFDGEPMEPGEDKDYTFLTTYPDDADCLQIFIYGQGNFCGERFEQPYVLSKDISHDVVISKIEDRNYTGEEITPDITVIFTNENGTTFKLVKDEDYTLTWDSTDRTNPGEKKFHLNGRTSYHYTGRLDGSFNIVKADAGPGDFTVTAPEDAAYDGKAHKASAIYTGPYAQSSCNYELKYMDAEDELHDEAVDAGTYEVYIHVLDSSALYKESLFKTGKTFSITPQSITNAFVSYSQTATFTGEDIYPEITVTYNGKPLTAGALNDYELTGQDNLNAGTGKFKVKGVNNFTGITAEKTFLINPKPLQSNVTVTAPAQTYSGQAITPKLTVIYTNPAEHEIALTADTDYDAVITNNIAAGTASIQLTGKGNYVGELSGSFTIEKKTAAKEDFTVTVPEGKLIYDGKAHAATASLNSPCTGCDFTVCYKNTAGEVCDEAVDAGTYTVCINVMESSDNFKSGLVETDATFTVAKKEVTIVPAQTPATKNYGEKDPEKYECTINGILEGDSVEVTLFRAEGEGPGEYSVIAYTFTGDDKDNYTSKALSGTLLIIKDPVFITEDDGKIVWNGEENLTFHISGYAEKLVRVLVDGNTVAPNNYIVKNGSTIIELKPSYLNTLKDGKHTLTAVYEDTCYVDGHATVKEFSTDAEFTVSKKSDVNKKDGKKSKAAATGDDTNFFILIMAIMTSLFVIIHFFRKQRKIAN